MICNICKRETKSKVWSIPIYFTKSRHSCDLIKEILYFCSSTCLDEYLQKIK